MVLFNKSTMISCSVAQAKHFCQRKAFTCLMSARHDQEGADPRNGQAADSRNVAKPVSERESLEHEHDIRLPHEDRLLLCTLPRRSALVRAGPLAPPIDRDR